MKYQITHKDKHPILQVFLDKIPTPLKAIIDTACAGNVIFLGNSKAEDYDYFELKGNKGTTSVAGGTKLTQEYVLHGITIGDWKFQLEFGLTPGTFEDIAVILGSKFLYENKISLFINGDYFILNKEGTNEIVLVDNIQ